MEPFCTMMITNEQWQRYIDNQCTSAEKKQILQYLQTLSEAELQTALEKNGMAAQVNIPVETALRMDAFIFRLTATTAKQQKKTIRLRYYWAAACIAAMAVGLLLFREMISRQQPRAITSYNSIQNPGPHLKRITLPDSSHVWLTPHSLLQVASDYAKNSREVLLQGEAYFEINPDPRHPFVAITNGISTTVLGTHFNIESYTDENETRITLTEGKVAVQPPHGIKDNAWILTPGKRLSYRHDLNSTITDSVTGINESDWKTGAIVLKDLPAAEVFKRLERRFGKKMVYAPSLFKDKRFTATYHNADLHTILNNMAYIHGFEYLISTGTVHIHSSK